LVVPSRVVLFDVSQGYIDGSARSSSLDDRLEQFDAARGRPDFIPEAKRLDHGRSVFQFPIQTDECGLAVSLDQRKVECRTQPSHQEGTDWSSNFANLRFEILDEASPVPGVADYGNRNSSAQSWDTWSIEISDLVLDL
jgi:hypothetical protein